MSVLRQFGLNVLLRRLKKKKTFAEKEGGGEGEPDNSCWRKTGRKFKPEQVKSRIRVPLYNEKNKKMGEEGVESSSPRDAPERKEVQKGETRDPRSTFNLRDMEGLACPRRTFSGRRE